MEVPRAHRGSLGSVEPKMLQFATFRYRQGATFFVQSGPLEVPIYAPCFQQLSLSCDWLRIPLQMQRLCRFRFDARTALHQSVAGVVIQDQVLIGFRNEPGALASLGIGILVSTSPRVVDFGEQTLPMHATPGGVIASLG